MNEAPQHQPTSSTPSSTNAAGPQSALGVPSVGAALARPATLYLTLTDGTVLPVGNAHFRAANEAERAQYPFREVIMRSDADLAFAVNAAWESWRREMECEPAHEADRESHYLALYGGRR